MSTRNPKTLMSQMYPPSKSNRDNKPPKKTSESNRIQKPKENDTQSGKLKPLF